MLDVLLVFIVTLFALWWWLTGWQRDLPPSPGLAFPVIGHLYLVPKNPFEKFMEWRKQLGDLYMMHLGNKRVVFVNGYDAIYEVLVKQHHHFLGRPSTFYNVEVFGFKGVLSLEGEEWKEHREFLQTALRSLGMGKNMMAERTGEEVDYLLKIIAKTNGTPTDFYHDIMVCVSNIICGVSFGKRFNHDDESFKEALNITNEYFRIVGISSYLNFLPWLKYVPGDIFYYKQAVKLFNRLKKWVWECIAMDKRERSSNDNSTEDIVQAFIIEMEKRKACGSPILTIDEDNMIATLTTFCLGGSETTAGTIAFALLYLVKFPDIQERLFQEIYENVGTSRLPTLAEKAKLKYLNAFIMETQRYTSLVPFTIDRLATEDVRINGYIIPEGSSVICSLDSLLMDKNVWGDPENFRPERFLSNNPGDRKKEFLPFSIGRRNCLGEGMAMMELYMFLSALIQRFQFQPENPGQKPSLVAKPGFTRTPSPCKLKAILR